MLKNYIKIVLRDIINHKSYSFTKIACLAVGMAAFILALLYVQHELSYDKFNQNFNRIYRIEQVQNYQEGKRRETLTPVPLGPALMNDFPDIVNFARILKTGGHLYYGKNKRFYEDEGLFADHSIFDIFSFSFVKGDLNTALTEPYSIVLTEKLSKKYFADEDPLGKFIRFENNYDLKVTGVLKNPPLNSHFKFRFIISLSSCRGIYGDHLFEGWDDEIFTYVLTPEIHAPGKLNENIRDSLNHYKNEKVVSELHLNPLSKIYFDTEASVTIGPTNNMMYVFLLFLIAVLTLLVASVNFMNLSTAYSTTRAKEVGVRKVIGSSRFLLIKQFLWESILISLISAIIAVVIVMMFLPEFNNLMQTKIVVSFPGNWILLVELFFIALLVGIMSGSYPAFFLSSFQPAKVLKGALKSGAKSGALRKIFVTFQYLISIIFIIIGIILLTQMNYLKNKDLGFGMENILYQEIDTLDNKRFEKIEAFKDELLKNPHILKASLFSTLPYVSENSVTVNWEGASDDESTVVFMSRVDYDFIDMYGIELIEGRNFSKEFSTDMERACIINETAVKNFGWDSPIGKRIDDNKLTVIGVAKDFHNVVLHYKIEPEIMILYKGTEKGYVHVSVKISPGNVNNAVNFIKGKFNEFFPEDLFNFRFLDDNLDATFLIYDNITKVIGYFSILSIFIASLGLFAMVSFSIKERTKEIGIRKTLGASIKDILVLLSKELVRILIIANLIAWPIAYLVMDNLLRYFPYRINIQLWMFLISGFVAFLIPIGTMSSQILKAARANPVDALRYE